MSKNRLTGRSENWTHLIYIQSKLSQFDMNKEGVLMRRRLERTQDFTVETERSKSPFLGI